MSSPSNGAFSKITMNAKLPVNDDLPAFDSKDEEVIDLREYWNVIRRHLKSILALTFLAMVLATLVVFSMKPIYQSTATLLIETEEKKILSIEDVYSGGQQSREYLLTQFEVIKSKSLSRKVIKKLNLTEHPVFLPDAEQDSGIRAQLDALILGGLNLLPDSISVWFGLSESPSDTNEMSANNQVLSEQEIFLRKVEKQFSEMMSISPIRKTQLVNISFESTDHYLAAEMANAMALMYINDQMESRLEMTTQANSWLTERLSAIREKLKDSEGALQTYREREQLLEAGGVTGLVSNQLQDLNQKLISTQQELGLLEAATQQISKISSKNYQDYLSIPSVLSDKLVSDLINTASDKQQLLGTLSERYGPKHPRIISAAAALKSATAALESHVFSVVNGLENRYQLARSSESSTQKILSRTKGEMQNINSKQYRLGLLEREVETDRQMYNLFLNRTKETTVSGGIDKANARIVDKAIVKIEPVKPKKKLIVLIAGFLGVGFGVLIAFLFEHLNNTVKSSVDIEERLKLVVLGVLPLISGKTRNIGKIVKNDSRSPYTEGIRTIRTGIMLSSLDQPHKRIMVTSSLPHEGKSTTASNTAINLSEMNRVLLIDCDLRKPSIGQLFGLNRNADGLSELISQSASPKSCIHQWDDSQLYILPSGSMAPNPLELISSKRFKKCLETLSQQFDHIVIDTPPILPVSDALVISTLVDGVVFVVKADATPIPVVNDAVKRLRQSNAHILGGVLNQYNVKKHKQYGGYGGYSYAQGYYGETYGENIK
jgi:succinoglycan biosynthesis transport protein ExoP